MSLRSISLSCQAFCGMMSASATSWLITSGTLPAVIADTIFCASGANGTMLRSIELPLSFS